MENYPKYEKVTDHVIRVITEKGDEIPLNALLQNKKQLEEKKAQIEKILENINQILDNAKKMGITAEEEKK